MSLHLPSLARRILSPRAGREAIGMLACAAVPLWLFAGPVGPFRAPGLEGAGLYGQLFAAANVRAWLTGLPTQGGWPVAPLPAALQALLPLDPGWGLGLTMALAVWLAGYGPWRLARGIAPGESPQAVVGAILAALAAQTSPIVLRAIPSVDLAALALGPIALGLAHPRLAWIGGLWSGPGAVTFALAGMFGRRPAWLLAGLPALALATPATLWPGAMVPGARHVGSAPAYVTEGGATFPLPPGEQTAVRAAAALTRTGLWLAGDVAPTVRGNLYLGAPPSPGAGRLPPAGDPTGPGPQGGTAPPPVDAPPEAAPAPTDTPQAERPWFGKLLVPLQRVQGGVVAMAGLLVLLATRATRRWGGVGVVALVMITVVFGWQDAPGEAEHDAVGRAALFLLLGEDALARIPGGGVNAWAAVLPAIGTGGLAVALGASARGAVRRWSGFVAIGLAAFALVGVPLENPRLVAPVAALPPDPVRQALTTLDPGRLLVFPAPQWPYLQGQRPFAAVAWEAALAGQAIEVEGEDPAAAALIGALSALTGAPVDTVAAERLWHARPQSGASPLVAAHAAGWRYLLVDLDALPPLGRPRLDGWLAERAGMPVARDGSRLLYDLHAGPAAAGAAAHAPTGPGGYIAPPLEDP